MTNQPQPPTLPAPATWAVTYRMNGFDCLLTLTGDNGAELLPRAGAALTWLQANGAQPVAYPQAVTAQPPANGAPQAAQQPAPVPTLGNGQPDPAWCPVHSVTMSRRERDGQVWYSHKAQDGQYCKGGK